MKTSPAPSTARPCGYWRLNPTVVGGAPFAGTLTTRSDRNLHYLIQVVIRDEDVARSINRQTLRILEIKSHGSRRSAICRNLDHPFRSEPPLPDSGCYPR